MTYARQLSATIRKARLMRQSTALRRLTLLATLATALLVAAPLSALTFNLSTVDFSASSKPGSVGTVTFNNVIETLENSYQSATLTLGTVTIVVEFNMTPGLVSDTMTVTVPSGYVAIPKEVHVKEGQSGTIEIYSLEGLGV